MNYLTFIGTSEKVSKLIRLDPPHIITHFVHIVCLLSFYSNFGLSVGLSVGQQRVSKLVQHTQKAMHRMNLIEYNAWNTIHRIHLHIIQCIYYNALYSFHRIQCRKYNV